MQPGQAVRTPTGRRGTFVGLLYLPRHVAPHRIKVRIDLRPEGGRPIATVCYYHPADVAAEPPGDDCPDHGPYADDDCPKC